MVKLAATLDLGSSTFGVRVRVSLLLPNKDTYSKHKNILISWVQVPLG